MNVSYNLSVLMILMMMLTLSAGVNAARPSLANIQAQIDALKNQVEGIQSGISDLNREDNNNIKISSLELITVSQPITYANQIEAVCPYDKFIVSGGALSSNYGYVLTQSYPDDCTNSRCGKWVAHASPRDEYNVPGAGSLYVYALCSN